MGSKGDDKVIFAVRLSIYLTPAAMQARGSLPGPLASV